MQDNQGSSDGQKPEESGPAPDGAGADEPELGHNVAEPAQSGASIQPKQPQPVEGEPHYGEPGPGYGQPGPGYGEPGGPGYIPTGYIQPGFGQPGYGQPG